MRGQVCRLHLLLAFSSAVIVGSQSRGTRDHISLSQIRDCPNLEGQVPVFISSRNRVAQLYPQTLGSLFVASYDSQGYSGGIRTRLGTDLIENTVSNNVFDCYVRIRCRGNVFTQPLPRNGPCDHVTILLLLYLVRVTSLWL
jgi:hypothetical protein